MFMFCRRTIIKVQSLWKLLRVDSVVSVNLYNWFMSSHLLFEKISIKFLKINVKWINSRKEFTLMTVESHRYTHYWFEPGHEKMCLMSYANNKGADQLAHPRSLISALFYSLLRQYNISRFFSRNFMTLASFCGCSGRFVSGMVGNSHRHILSCRGSFLHYTSPILLFNYVSARMVFKN